MKEQDPIKLLLDQLSAVLDQMHENAGKPMSPLTPQEEKRLEVLEEAVKRFKEATDRGLELENFDLDETKRKVMNERDKFPREQRTQIETTLKMGQDLIALKIGHDRAIKKLKNQNKKTPQEAEKPTKEKIVKRKGKFKKVGGDKKWNRI